MTDATLLARYDTRVPRYTSYPTAPQFHPGIGQESYRAWLGELAEDTPLSLYLHVPFCDTLCWFCGCQTTVVRRPEPVAAYHALLLREIDLLAGTLPAVGHVGHVHLGGGSPSILKPDQITSLFQRLKDAFALGTDCRIDVEIDPRGLAEATVAAFAAAGLSRASIGVQDLDPEVQRAVNRVQSFATTARSVEMLRAHGVSGINIDLMYGLPHQTVAGTLRTVARVLELAPERVALFGYAHVPWMKRHQRLIPEAALPGTLERWRQCEAAGARLVAAGYRRIGLDHFALPEDELTRAQAERRLRRNFQGYTVDDSRALLALGASGIGALPQGYVQNHRSVRDYRAALDAGGLPVARGVRLSRDDRMRGAAIEAVMCDLTLDLSVLADAYDDDLAAFQPVLDRLREMERDRLLRVEGWRITVLEAGRPFLRNIAAVFDRYLEPETSRHARAI